MTVSPGAGESELQFSPLLRARARPVQQFPRRLGVTMGFAWQAAAQSRPVRLGLDFAITSPPLLSSHPRHKRPPTWRRYCRPRRELVAGGAHATRRIARLAGEHVIPVTSPLDTRPVAGNRLAAPGMICTRLAGVEHCALAARLCRAPTGLTLDTPVALMRAPAMHRAAHGRRRHDVALAASRSRPSSRIQARGATAGAGHRRCARTACSLRRLRPDSVAGGTP